MWPCKQLDLSWRDWRFALGRCLAPPPWREVAERVERLWPSGRGVLACMNVRSAFDLYLRARRWALGDEIVFSALTVPDMPAIARRHGLRVVPIDVDADTGAWRTHDLERAIGPKTRAVVLTHPFGARLDVAPAIATARARGIAVVEDCAQAYLGPAWTGHPDADLALFSFGPMKTATALGGAVAHVRDPETLERMRRQRGCQPAQPTAAFLRRVLVAGGLKLAGNPRVYGALAAVLGAVGADRERWVHRLTRNTRPGTAALRQRPCAALLALLERRLAEGDAPVTRRTAPARALFDAVGPGVRLPTRDAEPHAYWMAPVLVPDPEACKEALRGAGFDAMSARLCAVSGEGVDVPGARCLASAVHLPFDPDMPPEELARLGESMTRFDARGSPGRRPV